MGSSGGFARGADVVVKMEGVFGCLVGCDGRVTAVVGRIRT